MKKHITNIYGYSPQSTAMIGQHMMTEIAKKEGYSEIGISVFPVRDDTEEELEKRISGMLGAVEADDLVVVQLPSWFGIAFDEVFIRILRDRCNKLAIFVHDYAPLMFENNRYLMPYFLDMYNKADIVALPSDKMGKILVDEGLTVPYIVQRIWDHVTDIKNIDYPKFLQRIKFAGNLKRFPFAKHWKYDIPLEIYSDPVEGIIESKNLIRNDWKKDDQLLRSLNSGGFGLVWSEDIENQAEREYSTMNASYKFSTYLAAGLPIIVNKGLGKQEFVEEYKIGYAAESLNDAVNYVKNISANDYSSICQNVKKISELIRQGYFGRRLLMDIEDKVFLNS